MLVKWLNYGCLGFLRVKNIRTIANLAQFGEPLEKKTPKLHGFAIRGPPGHIPSFPPANELQCGYDIHLWPTTRQGVHNVMPLVSVHSVVPAQTC